ncbi:hypothetical protein JCM11251_001742 [Rhodosporidiobolus azoricus]
MSNADQQQQEPSTVSSTLKSLQGQAYQAVGSISSDPSWKQQGEQLQKMGEEEADEVRAKQKGEAGWERVEGKVQSAYGLVSGDQSQQTQGNLKAEEGEWKSALADGEVPSMSWDRVKGKVESAVGMATGDQEKQNEGNLKAEKAEWTKG